MKELARIFLKLGTTAFGGPAAHIAMLEEEIVRRRKWITHEHFLDLLGATYLIPGPNSTEMAIHIGYVRGGWKGLLVAGICFIGPAVAITLLFAYLYRTFGTLPQFDPFMAGIRAAIIAVVAAAFVRLIKPIRRKPEMLILCGLVTGLSLSGVDEILLLFCGGLAGFLWQQRDKLRRAPAAMFSILPPLTSIVIPTLNMTSSADNPTLIALGLFFLKIGSILYGSGYVLIAFLQGGLVTSHHWLTQHQLLDAVAVGQFTPGPVLSTATFIGYLILGIPGAAVATAGIFLPSFIFVLITGRYIPRLQSVPTIRGFLDGVNSASLGLMLAVSITLAFAALSTSASWIICILSLIIVYLWNPNAVWIIAGAAILNWFFSVTSLFTG